MPFTPFAKGNPGKPKGAINIARRRLIEAMAASMQDLDALKRDIIALRSGTVKEKAIYYQLLGKLVPQNVDLDAGGDVVVRVITGWAREPRDPVDGEPEDDAAESNGHEVGATP